MARETLWEAFKQMGPLVIGALTPLVLATGKREPGALALGTFLSVLLGKMTFNLDSSPSQSFDLLR